MMTQSNTVFSGTQEVLAQLAEFITAIRPSTYRYIALPYFDSSIGQHVRHILDLYNNLLTNLNTPEKLIDYDCRRRDSTLETQPDQARQEIQRLQQALCDCNHNTDHPVVIKTEVSCYQTNSVQLPSSFLREICFVSLHTIHHLASMAAIARMAHDPVVGYYGIAPTTASYFREHSQTS